MIRFSQLEETTGGKNLLFTNDSVLTHLLTDSRKATINPGSIFFAVKGKNHDGHAYISSLYKSGIRQFVIEKNIDVSGLQGSNILLVSSCLDALQKIAGVHRKSFGIPIIGITGSNGKTIIKEWLYQLLSNDWKIVKNPGSYNSQIGVPLSVWQIQSHHQIGIFEAGISKTGEMKNLADVIQPTIGIFTNIGSAHNEGFTSIEEKAREKIKLFERADIVIYNRDQALIDRIFATLQIKTLCWGLHQDADIKVKKVNAHYTFQWKGNSFELVLPFSDAASIENILHCIAVMLYLGLSPAVIQQRISSLRSVPMRLELKEGINQCQIIDDSYNNDLGGLQISLDFLSNQHQKKKKRLILSDMLESGLDEESLASKIADLVSGGLVQNFIGIGAALSRHQNLFRQGSLFFSDTQNFLDRFDFEQLHDEIILVKGARAFQFEKIVSRLQRKVHGTVMEIDLGSVVHNLNFFKSKLRPETKIMVMVKAFAYGSGSTEIANLLQYHKVDYLGVAYADEGVELRKNNIALPVMVMNPSEESFPQILAFNLEPEVYSFKILHNLLNFLQGKACTLHLKFDTGMHRLGFEENDLEALINILQTNSNLKVASIFTHLAGADEATHDLFSRQQAASFLRWANRISHALGYKPLYHVLNSPGILRLPDLQMDMVRLGIGLYGVDPTPYGYEGLKPVATLKTIISQIKHIRPGETIGYGRRGEALKPTTIATIAIGYADGFNRAFSRGVGEVLIHGKRAAVIGNVCMDMTMVDITGIDAQEGDDVIIFGSGMPITEVAQKINTIPYEILTNTSERVKRIFFAESI